jgi:serine/threonine protein kinase
MEAIGKYQVLRELGRGASGKVYLAMDPFTKRQVAIKVAFPEALKHSEDGAFYRSMFLNEAALAGKLNHPHIVEIYDAVVEEKSSYIVMEYVEGGTLEKFCEPDALLPPAEVAEIIFKCVRALAFAATIGLTHRDIKPGNILHVDGTDIKIADFGASINKVSDRTVITNVGSPAYMAPELVTGTAQAGASTDIYALGVVMYYLLCGRLPFEGANTMSVIYQIVNTEASPPSAHRESVSPELEAIVMKAIAKDPATTSRGSGRRPSSRASASRATPSASACAGTSPSSRTSRKTTCGRCCACPSGASFRPTPYSSRKATTATRSSFSPAATCGSPAPSAPSTCSRPATASARWPTWPRPIRPIARRR